MPTENLKVLHVIARFNIGGTARYLSELLPELHTHNIETLLAIGNVQAGEVEDSRLTGLSFIRVNSLGRRVSPLQDLRSYLSLRRIVKTFCPDLIHSHTFKSGVLCRLMYFGIPKVHTFHGHLLTDPEFSRAKIKIDLIIEKFLANFTHKIIVTGEQVAEDLLASGIGRPDKFISIPGEGGLTNVLPQETARKNLSLGEAFTIMWVGRVAPVKNPKLLVEVAKRMPDCQFVMVGDGIELSSIRSAAPANLRILGFTPVNEVLLAGDVFLSTSLNEGIPYAILEARSVGLPVVAVSAGALSELITDGLNGYLVEPDADKIVARLLELSKNPTLLKNFKTQAINATKDKGGVFALSHVGVYRKICR